MWDSVTHNSPGDKTRNIKIAGPICTITSATEGACIHHTVVWGASRIFITANNTDISLA